ncbi:MAG: hypothetical protein RLY97_1254 [Pseudomonadota bacterium]
MNMADLSLAELRVALAPTIADAAVFDGWSRTAVEAAADAHGVNRDVAQLAFKDGPMAMIAAWIADIDGRMAHALPMELLAQRKVRVRMGDLVRFRLEAIAGREEALRRAQAVMAMPRNLAASLRLGWASADAMWRLAGDTAADYNHYTKRTLLAGIYTATLAVWVDDSSEGKTDSLAFLDRRIDGVMQFEKAKAKFLSGGDMLFSPARFMGRLRYPARV